MICTLHHISLDYQIRENEMGIACCMEDSLEDPGNDQRIILKWILTAVEGYRLDSCGSTTGGLLCRQTLFFRFSRLWKTSRLAE